MKYQVKITGLGSDALAFLGDETNFIIIFNEDAPPELAEISVLHTKCELNQEIQKDDTLKIGTKQFKITKVGEEAAYTLRNLGHCTLDFSGDESAFRPGCIMLEKGEITAEDLTVGTTIEIF